MNRRKFIKNIGLGSAVSAMAIAGCAPRKNPADGKDIATDSPIPVDSMTYRTNPTTGDKVSLLGYGCMRWPVIPVEGGGEGEDRIDQETVNRLVDTAIKHGVNYFDTSPAYCKGRSEAATGIALSRYPRDSYFIATKLSNFSPSTWSRQESMKMYKDSFKNLQTDYIDYLLLHAVGMGDDGMENLKDRYIKNGMLDFLPPNARPEEYAISDSPTTATSVCSTICFRSTTNTNGTSCRFSSTISTGSTPKK